MTKNARVRSAFDLRKRLVNVGTLKWSFFTALRPRDASNAFEDFFEFLILATAVEITLKTGDVALVAVVPARLVKDLDEHLQQGIVLVFADQRRLLIDVEQKALRCDAVSLGDQCREELIVCLRAEMFRDLTARVVMPVDVAEEVGKHLKQVRFTGTEEARDPHSVGVRVVGVRLQHMLDTLRGLIREDVLLDFDAELRSVISFNDALNRSLDIFGEDFIDQCHRHASCSRMSFAR